MRLTLQSTTGSWRCGLFAVLLPLLLVAPGCRRSAIGGDDPDGGTPGSDATTPGRDALVPPPDAYIPGCEPQVVYEDPNIDCDGCAYCDDLTPWLWTGERCSFEPICCACAGPDCDRRWATFGQCSHAHGHCPHAQLEVEYPEARLIFMAPGGFAGWGPALHLDGYGAVRSWNTAAGSPDWDRPDPDYSEDLGIEAANELFGLLADVDFTNLPHDPQITMECYPTFWLLWEQCPGCEPLRLDYASALDLQPELNLVYAWFAERLCRGGDDPDYPVTLPGDYCVFYM